MNNISALSNIFKIRYEKLSASIKIDNKDRNKTIMMIIDIGYIMKILFNIVERNKLVITNKDKGIMFAAIMNIVAHYRHFFHTSMRMENTFILYCGNNSDYEEYDDIIKDLYDFAKFIPNFIVVPKTNTRQKYYYYHTIGYIIEYAKKMCDHDNKEMNLVSLNSSNPFPIYQFGKICKNTFYISCNNEKIILNHNDLWTKKLLIEDNRFNNIKYAYMLDKILYPYLIYYKKIIDERFTLDNKVLSRYETRANQIFEFIDLNPKCLDVSYTYGKFLEFSDDDINKCKSIMKDILYQNNPTVKNFIKDLIRAWNQKLHDKKLSNINEFYDLLSENNIIILWLNECKG